MLLKLMIVNLVCTLNLPRLAIVQRLSMMAYKYLSSIKESIKINIKLMKKYFYGEYICLIK